MGAEIFRRKVVLIGSTCVGKTCIFNRVRSSDFDEYQAPSCQSGHADLTIGESHIPIRLWDTAGQERFRATTSAYVRDAAAALLVFSQTDRASFDALPKWMELLETASPSCPVVLVANKEDLRLSSETLVQWDDAQKWAFDHEIEKIVSVSAKTGKGIWDMQLQLNELLTCSVGHVKEKGVLPPPNNGGQDSPVRTCC
jgi:small GTP-binding protein